MVQVFDFKDYREFLKSAMNELAKVQKGVRGRFASFIGCQPSYLSQVLRGSTDLSFEQADRANAFFEHTDDQGDYFLLLLSLARAGTESLKRQYLRKVLKEQSQYWRLRNRLKSSTGVSPKALRTYYSNWRYATILMALTVPGLREPEALAARFRLPLKEVREVLEFLVNSGLAKVEESRYLPGEKWIHTGNDRELTIRDHVNWRLRAIHAVEALVPTELHYSSVFTISAADFEKVRAVLVKAIQDSRDVIAPSPEERVCNLLVDLFEV